MSADADPAALRSVLCAGLDALALDLTQAQTDRLLAYLALLHKWNQVYNLTALRDPQQMLVRNLLDCLAALAPLRRQLDYLAQAGAGAAGPGALQPRLLDVGSGAGLPGLVFALCCPDLAVDCVDAVGKKAAFVRQAALALGLSNLQSLHARVQTLSGPYHIIACRAFGALPDLVSCTRAALARPLGVWLALKGRSPENEIAALPCDVAVFHVEPLQVPGLQAARSIVWMRPA